MVLYTERRADEAVKENVARAAPLTTRWLAAALAAAAGSLALAALADRALPPLRARGAAPPTAFCAHAAYEHLLNLTAVGPRVAGSYENEVVAVGVLVAALREIARGAAPHHRVELDVFTTDGAFPLAFLDGMNHEYRGVSSVAARVSARGAAPHRTSGALLFNCHYDTVPDSPGASDDGAGCAVLLETLRALAAGRALPRAAVFLFNGAEENVLQASHGFVSQHRWARGLAAFVNLEACGVGGREVVFQAGPRARRLLAAYRAAVPRPCASSLAQELFRSGLVPAETDFRIFRDFGNLSGLDLAWSADGYAYHTRLDAPARLPPAALQRTGDHVLALAHELLRAEPPAEQDAQEEGEPVFFDVLGLWAVSVRAPHAAAAALAALALVALELHAGAAHARAELYLSVGAWARAVRGAALAAAGAWLAGVAAAIGVALLQNALGCPLAVYSRPWLLLPLYALPALASAWHVMRRSASAGGALRGWWAARTVHAACSVWAGAALAACLAARLRSGFLPALWAGGGGAAGALAPRRWGGGARAALCALAAAPAALQTLYLGVGLMRTLVPVAGRAGAGALPADAALAALAGALALAGTAWLLPLVAAARPARALLGAMWAACGAALVLVWCSGRDAAYSPATPQRLMVFHVRRTLHAAPPAPPHAPAAVDLLYWVPELDDNTAYTLHTHVPALRSAARVSRSECARRVWCGVPYYLPVLSLVPRSMAAPAGTAPRAALHVDLHSERLAPDTLEVRLQMVGTQHVVVIVAAGAGARLVWSSAGADPLEAPRWDARRVYFFALHDARAPRPFSLTLRLQREQGAEGEWAALSVAGHALFGENKTAPEHARLLDALPPSVAGTGWGVDLHLYTV